MWCRCRASCARVCAPPRRSEVEAFNFSSDVTTSGRERLRYRRRVFRQREDQCTTSRSFCARLVARAGWADDAKMNPLPPSQRARRRLRLCGGCARRSAREHDDAEKAGKQAVGKSSGLPRKLASSLNAGALPQKKISKTYGRVALRRRRRRGVMDERVYIGAADLAVRAAGVAKTTSQDSTYPFEAASSRVHSYHGQPFSRAHFSTSRWP